jgi:hypothetical protein
MEGIDTHAHPTAQQLAARSLEFLKEVKDFTPGRALEERLNRDYGPGNEYFDDFCKLVKQGFEEGWVASGDLDHGKYRRGRVRAESCYLIESWRTVLTVVADPTAARGQPLHELDGRVLR